MWPGIALTERRGAACVPIAADVARFWISRLHGPEANDWAVLRCLAIAAQKLTDGDEAGAQTALDASGLTRLSSDSAVLMRAVAGSLGIAPLDLPWAEGPRLWRAEDIQAHLPLFKDYAPAASLLAKAGAWDESKHPRWPAGSPDSQGGRFNHGEGGPVTEGRSVSSDNGGSICLKSLREDHRRERGAGLLSEARRLARETRPRLCLDRGILENPGGDSVDP